MAVVLKATPNPVTFTQNEVNSKAHKPTVLTWDTGNAMLQGKLFRAVNGQAEAAVPGMANVLAQKGNLTDTVGYSDTVVYTLRDSANKALATVTVKTALLVPPPPPPVGPLQQIRDVRIIPRGDCIWVRFDTALPSAPFVQIIDPSSGRMVGLWSRPELKTSHAMMFDGIGEPLKQNQQHYFRIVADKNKPVHAVTNPAMNGSVVTGIRYADVTFGGIGISPKLKNGGGPLSFGIPLDVYLAAGDVDRWTVAGRRHLGKKPEGTSAFLSETFSIVDAGRQVWAFAEVQHVNPSGVWASFSLDLSDDPFSPPQPGVSSFYDDDEQIGSVTAYYDSHPSLPAGPDWAPVLPKSESHTYQLVNDDFVERYELSVVVSVRLTDGSWTFEGWTPEQMRLYRVSHSTISKFDVSKVAKLLLADGASAKHELSPYGELIVSEAGLRQHEGAPRIVGDRLRHGAVAVGADGVVHVAAVNSEGAVLAAVLDGERDHATQWVELGLRDVVAVASGVGTDGETYVLALGEDRVLRYAVVVAGDVRSSWRDLAERVVSFVPISAVGIQPGAAVVLGDGSVLGVLLDDRDPQRFDLGSVRHGEIEAAYHREDGSVSLLVVDEVGGASVFGWSEYPTPPHAPEWQMLGDREALFAGFYADAQAGADLGQPSDG